MVLATSIGLSKPEPSAMCRSRAVGDAADIARI